MIEFKGIGEKKQTVCWHGNGLLFVLYDFMFYPVPVLAIGD
jgi:hypothetical protein